MGRRETTESLISSLESTNETAGLQHPDHRRPGVHAVVFPGGSGRHARRAVQRSRSLTAMSSMRGNPASQIRRGERRGIRLRRLLAQLRAGRAGRHRCAGESHSERCVPRVVRYGVLGERRRPRACLAAPDGHRPRVRPAAPAAAHVGPLNRIRRRCGTPASASASRSPPPSRVPRARVPCASTWDTGTRVPPPQAHTTRRSVAPRLRRSPRT